MVKLDGKRKLILNAHLYKLGVQIKQIECAVNFSDRYWKHPRSEICYLVRIEFIHSDMWTRNKRIASASEVQAVDTIDISLFLARLSLRRVVAFVGTFTKHSTRSRE